MSGLRVLIVDDHASFRSVARTLLRRGGFDVVGESDTMAGGIRAVDEMHPDVVVLDIQLPDGDGIDGAARISARSAPPAVVLVSSRPASEIGERLANAHARGFIAKDELTAAGVQELL